MKQYIVDAFTNQPFSGNPAAVCVMDNWPSKESMMKQYTGKSTWLQIGGHYILSNIRCRVLIILAHDRSFANLQIRLTVN